MIRVRMKNGTVLTYNEATNMFRDTGGKGWDIKTKGGQVVAFVQDSAGAIVEFSAPCSVWQSGLDTLLETIERVIANEGERLSWSEADALVRLKRVLSRFNATTKDWK